MRSIEVSDEDYETLMQLSKELQNQPNHGQSFPYFWEPQSERLEPNLHGEGEVAHFRCNGDECDPQTKYEGNEQNTISFLEENDFPLDSKWDDLTSDQHDLFCDYLVDNCDVEKYTSNYEYKSEHNPSLFLSDVKYFIECNSHHLGRNPQTYARTIWRMPKMEKLIKAIYRINANNNEEINHEAKQAIA